MLTARPILFSAPMVRALLDGTKTQTRRLMVGPGAHKGSKFADTKQWSRIEADGTWIGWYPGFSTQEKADAFTQRAYKGGGVQCPYGVAGDRLWVRETWQHADWTEDGMPWIRYAADGAVRFIEGHKVPESWGERLTDRWADLSDPANVAIDGKAADRKWRPSIFMPPWASRITLEITEVRVQRLQDISEADAEAEGIQFLREHPDSDETLTAHQLYKVIWEHINGAGSWGANPWVWALTFKRVEATP